MGGALAAWFQCAKVSTSLQRKPIFSTTKEGGRAPTIAVPSRPLSPRSRTKQHKLHPPPGGSSHLQ